MRVVIHRTSFLLLPILGSACQAAIIMGPPIEPEERMLPGEEVPNAASFFAENVQSILVSDCAGCHEDAMASAGADFLEPGNYYASMLAWPDLVVPGEPSRSGLLNRGEHRGPALRPDDAATIETWIDAEGAAIAPPMMEEPGEVLETIPAEVEEGENRLTLTDVGLAGSELVFWADRVFGGRNLRLTRVELVAGSGGLQASQPQLVVHDLDTMRTWEDSEAFLGDGSIRVEEGGTGILAYSHVLADFPARGALSIRFGSVSPIGGD